MATSRPARWAEAISRARAAMATAQGELESAFEDLRDIQSSYQDWLDNLPEMAQGGATEEKLQGVVDVDLEVETQVFDELEAILEELDALELPRGFGRD